MSLLFQVDELLQHWTLRATLGNVIQAVQPFGAFIGDFVLAKALAVGAHDEGAVGGLLNSEVALLLYCGIPL